MNYRTGLTLLAAVILLGAGILQAQTKTVEEIVALVNSDIILKSELDRELTKLRAGLAAPAPQGGGLSGAQLEQAFAEQSKNKLRDLIDQALLLQKAKEMDMTADLELIKTMERMRQEYKFESLDALEKAIVEQGNNIDEFKQEIKTRYLTGQVLGREVYGKVIITVEDMRKYYDEHKKDFDRPEGVHIRMITVSIENRGPEQIASQKQKAEEALAAIKKGDDFAEVAQKFSEAENAQDGGDLGFFEKGQLNKSLEDEALKLEKGQTTDVLTMPYGFVIIKVDDKHTGGVLPFELAQKEIQDTLFSQRVQPKIREYLTKLRGDGFIKVYPGYADTGEAAKSAKVSDAEPRK
jgi:peptidyl-prolyl cis-trans isomerase SurA